MSLSTLFFLMPILAGYSAMVQGSVADLYRADEMIAQQPQDPEAHVAASELVAGILGQVLDEDGRPAQMGYEYLYARAWDAVERAGNPAELVARLQALPAPSRGATGGRVAIPDQSRELREEITFAANSPAMVYVRTQPAASVRMRITTANGQSICSRMRQNGRAFCNWNPLHDQRVVVTAWLVDDEQEASLSLFTN